MGDAERKQLERQALELEAAYAESAYRESGASSNSDMGSSPDKPITEDIFGDDTKRIAGSYADLGGLKELTGAYDAVINKGGQAAIKGKDGKWRVDANSFTDNPVNYLESSVGGSLPYIGAGIFGTLGGVFGFGAGAIPGAVAGGAIGKLMQEASGRYQGVRKTPFLSQETASQMGDTASTMAAAEMMAPMVAAKLLPISLPGRGAGNLKTDWMSIEDAARNSIDTIKNTGRTAFAKAASLLTGVPEGAYNRVIERPWIALGKSPSASEAAKAAEEEMLRRRNEVRGRVGNANADFLGQFGDQQVDTSPLFAIGERMRAQRPTSSTGVGALTSEEQRQLREWELKHLASRRGELTPAPDPAAVRSEPVVVPKTDSFSLPPKTVEEIHYQNTYPERTWNDVIAAKDYLDLKEITDVVHGQNVVVPKSEPAQRVHQAQAGQIRDMSHALDPRKKAADTAYSQFMDDAKLLANTADTKSQEAVVNNMFAKNKTAQQEAAERVYPNAYHGPIKDVAAVNEFTKSNPIFGPMTRNTARLGLGAALGIGSYAANVDPENILAMELALAGITSPTLMKKVAANVSNRSPWGFVKKSVKPSASLGLMNYPVWKDASSYLDLNKEE